MEPLIALSIAAAVVQFVDFSSNVIKGALNNYKSASSQTIKNHELATIAQDLSRLVGDAESKLGDGHGDSSTPTYDIFRRLCNECRDIHGALDQIFEKLRPRGETKLALAVSSFGAELMKVYGKSEIDKRVEQLNQVRQQATVAVLCLSL